MGEFGLLGLTKVSIDFIKSGTHSVAVGGVEKPDLTPASVENVNVSVTMEIK